MQPKRTRYPSYDVLTEKDQWDGHTREIVIKRLGPFPENRFLNDHEADMVYAVARHIVYDERREILEYVVHHLDNILSSPRGENQRKVNTPEQKTLLRRGLKAIDNLAQEQFGVPFLKADTQQQFAVLNDLAGGKALPLKEWQRIPQKDLFKKLATEIVGAYYSHPLVWSEIGYGGPAYPRGYIRVEMGLTDPWEAKRDAGE